MPYSSHSFPLSYADRLVPVLTLLLPVWHRNDSNKADIY
nr:MAG TPA: hypothetical protein [Caudoviricetes sp.]